MKLFMWVIMPMAASAIAIEPQKSCKQKKRMSLVVFRRLVLTAEGAQLTVPLNLVWRGSTAATDTAALNGLDWHLEENATEGSGREERSCG